MRKRNIIHAELSEALTSLRHTDLFAISDSGLPVPAGIPVIDLGVVYGLPGFLPVLDAVLAEVVVEAAYGSEQVADLNPEVHRVLKQQLDADLLDHDEFKARLAQCRFVVRTGEATPFANVLLRAGVPWL